MDGTEEVIEGEDSSEEEEEEAVEEEGDEEEGQGGGGRGAREGVVGGEESSRRIICEAVGLGLPTRNIFLISSLEMPMKGTLLANDI